MDGGHRKRSKRWNRRSSDGAAWGSDTEVSESDEDLDRQQEDRRRPRCSMAFRGVASVPLLFNREPLRITREFRDRVAAAARASAVATITLGTLLLTRQGYLPAAWIGNVLALSTLKSTLGDTTRSTKDVFVPMIPIALCAWGISTLLDSLSTTVYSILLPFVAMVGSGVIFLCPWPYLTMRNLMLLFFYVSVASPLSLRFDYASENESVVEEELSRWFVPGLAGTCTVGLIAALVVHVVLMPLPRSTTASRLAPTLVNQLACQTQQLLFSIAEYTQNIGRASSLARQARTLIEYYVKAMGRTVGELDKSLAAMRVENKLFCLKNDLGAMEKLVACSKKQLKHAELIRLATTQQFLGEDFTSLNESVRSVKATMSTNLGFAVEQLAFEYGKSESALLLGSHSNDDKYDIFSELDRCMDSYQKAMRQAIVDAEGMLLNDDAASRSTAGPLVRQRVAFLAVFSFVQEFRDMIAAIGKEKQADGESNQTLSQRFISTLKMPWLWNNMEKRRAAIKTAIGMGLASLWVSIPYLRENLAYPSSVWVGVTVASVSLQTTGATYIKSIDRLYATLVAAGYALFIGKVFDASNNIAKLCAVSLFTFGATLVTNYDRPYASRYAATSVGSILFGSIDRGMAVNEYVPVRIMLIFIGVVTFLFVELVVFPRSSRTIVQAQTLQFFEDLEHCIFDSSKVCGSIPLHSSNVSKNSGPYSEINPLWMLREGKEKVSIHDDVSRGIGTVKKTVALAKSELKPAIAEPSIGLNVTLDVAGYENLLIEQSRITQQLDLLTTTIKALTGYYTYLESEHPVRSLHWPALLSASLVKLANQLCECADKLREVFPHGLCRPGPCEVSQVIKAVASYRNFEDVILDILSDVEERHASYLSSMRSGGDVRYTPGFRLTLALAVSAILTIGKSLCNCGTALEAIVGSFPIEGVNLNEDVQLKVATTVHMGDSVDD